MHRIVTRIYRRVVIYAIRPSRLALSICVIVMSATSAVELDPYHDRNSKTLSADSYPGWKDLSTRLDLKSPYLAVTTGDEIESFTHNTKQLSSALINLYSKNVKNQFHMDFFGRYLKEITEVKDLSPDSIANNRVKAFLEFKVLKDFVEQSSLIVLKPNELRSTIHGLAMLEYAKLRLKKLSSDVHWPLPRLERKAPFLSMGITALIGNLSLLSNNAELKKAFEKLAAPPKTDQELYQPFGKLSPAELTLIQNSLAPLYRAASSGNFSLEAKIISYLHNLMDLKASENRFPNQPIGPDSTLDLILKSFSQLSPESYWPKQETDLLSKRGAPPEPSIPADQVRVLTRSGRTPEPDHDLRFVNATIPTDPTPAPTARPVTNKDSVLTGFSPGDRAQLKEKFRKLASTPAKERDPFPRNWDANFQMGIVIPNKEQKIADIKKFILEKAALFPERLPKDWAEREPVAKHVPPYLLREIEDLVAIVGVQKKPPPIPALEFDKNFDALSDDELHFLIHLEKHFCERLQDTFQVESACEDFKYTLRQISKDGVASLMRQYDPEYRSYTVTHVMPTHAEQLIKDRIRSKTNFTADDIIALAIYTKNKVRWHQVVRSRNLTSGFGEKADLSEMKAMLSPSQGWEELLLAHTQTDVGKKALFDKYIKFREEFRIADARERQALIHQNSLLYAMYQSELAMAAEIFQERLKAFREKNPAAFEKLNAKSIHSLLNHGKVYTDYKNYNPDDPKPPVGATENPDLTKLFQSVVTDARQLGLLGDSTDFHSIAIGVDALVQRETVETDLCTNKDGQYDEALDFAEELWKKWEKLSGEGKAKRERGATAVNRCMTAVNKEKRATERDHTIDVGVAYRAILDFRLQISGYEKGIAIAERVLICYKPKAEREAELKARHLANPKKEEATPRANSWEEIVAAQTDNQKMLNGKPIALVPTEKKEKNIQYQKDLLADLKAKREAADAQLDKAYETFHKLREAAEDYKAKSDLKHANELRKCQDKSKFAALPDVTQFLIAELSKKYGAPHSKNSPLVQTGSHLEWITKRFQRRQENKRLGTGPMLASAEIPDAMDFVVSEVTRKYGHAYNPNNKISNGDPYRFNAHLDFITNYFQQRKQTAHLARVLAHSNDSPSKNPLYTHWKSDTDKICGVAKKRVQDAFAKDHYTALKAREMRDYEVTTLAKHLKDKWNIDFVGNGFLTMNARLFNGNQADLKSDLDKLSSLMFKFQLDQAEQNEYASIGDYNAIGEMDYWEDLKDQIFTNFALEGKPPKMQVNSQTGAEVTLKKTDGHYDIDIVFKPLGEMVDHVDRLVKDILDEIRNHSDLYTKHRNKEDDYAIFKKKTYFKLVRPGTTDDDYKSDEQMAWEGHYVKVYGKLKALKNMGSIQSTTGANSTARDLATNLFTAHDTEFQGDQIKLIREMQEDSESRLRQALITAACFIPIPGFQQAGWALRAAVVVAKGLQAGGRFHNYMQLGQRGAAAFGIVDAPVVGQSEEGLYTSMLMFGATGPLKGLLTLVGAGSKIAFVPVHMSRVTRVRATSTALNRAATLGKINRGFNEWGGMFLATLGAETFAKMHWYGLSFEEAFMRSLKPALRMSLIALPHLSNPYWAKMFPTLASGTRMLMIDALTSMPIEALDFLWTELEKLEFKTNTHSVALQKLKKKYEKENRLGEFEKKYAGKKHDEAALKNDPDYIAALSEATWEHVGKHIANNAFLYFHAASTRYKGLPEERLNYSIGRIGEVPSNAREAAFLGIPPGGRITMEALVKTMGEKGVRSYEAQLEKDAEKQTPEGERARHELERRRNLSPEERAADDYRINTRMLLSRILDLSDAEVVRILKNTGEGGSMEGLAKMLGVDPKLLHESMVEAYGKEYLANVRLDTGSAYGIDKSSGVPSSGPSSSATFGARFDRTRAILTRKINEQLAKIKTDMSPDAGTRRDALVDQLKHLGTAEWSRQIPLAAFDPTKSLHKDIAEYELQNYMQQLPNHVAVSAPYGDFANYAAGRLRAGATPPTWESMARDYVASRVGTRGGTI